jgi:hypothetical protein
VEPSAVAFVICSTPPPAVIAPVIVLPLFVSTRTPASAFWNPFAPVSALLIVKVWPIAAWRRLLLVVALEKTIVRFVANVPNAAKAPVAPFNVIVLAALTSALSEVAPRTPPVTVRLPVKSSPAPPKSWCPRPPW